MSDKSSIEWTDATWNPVRGCTKISPGCTHCYAETFAERFRGVPGHPYEQGFDLRLVPEKLTEPLSWKNPRRVFVNSMSDLFHEDVPDAFIIEVFATMALARRHTFQALTKRPERMARLLGKTAFAEAMDEAIEEDSEASDEAHDATIGVWPLPNVWLGVSVEDQKRADERIPHLLATPAAVRFLSCEPLLGPIDISYPPSLFPSGPDYCCNDRECGCRGEPVDPWPWLWPKGEGIDWVIVGGESGHGARPMHVEWARSLVGQCKAAGVACFVKQMGPIVLTGSTSIHKESAATQAVRLKHKKGADPAEWPEDLRVREYPKAVTA